MPFLTYSSMEQKPDQDIKRQPGKQREMSTGDDFDNGQSYHSLPEITWNAETFNFDAEDFTMQQQLLQDRNMGIAQAANKKNNTNTNTTNQTNVMATSYQQVLAPPPSRKQDEQGRASPPKKVLRPCAHCGKTFSRSYDLHRHESSHSDERRFACEYPGCTKKYKLRQDLKAHERSAHEGRGGGGAVVLGHWRGYEDRLYEM